jgi:hypothetical protein
MNPERLPPLVSGGFRVITKNSALWMVIVLMSISVDRSSFEFGEFAALV